jgi:hypothetical protein
MFSQLPHTFIDPADFEKFINTKGRSHISIHL